MKNILSSGLLVLFLILSGCASEATDTSTDQAGPEAAAPADEPLADLVITDLVEGDGQLVQAGQTALVHYTLWFRDPSMEDNRGERLQSSKDVNRPFPFNVGRPGVIDAWNQGVPGMKVGGTRELQVPSRLAYGERGMPGAIPPNTDLVFEIEVLEIQ